MVGPTDQGAQALCGTPSPCNAPTGVPVRIMLWDQTNGGNGRNLWFHTRYIGTFMLMAYGGGQVTGYFTGVTATGRVANVPGPIPKIILVK
jgi:hypothetical protein